MVDETEALIEALKKLRKGQGAAANIPLFGEKFFAEAGFSRLELFGYLARANTIMRISPEIDSARIALIPSLLGHYHQRLNRDEPIPPLMERRKLSGRLADVSLRSVIRLEEEGIKAIARMMLLLREDDEKKEWDIEASALYAAMVKVNNVVKGQRRQGQENLFVDFAIDRLPEYEGNLFRALLSAVPRTDQDDAPWVEW